MCAKNKLLFFIGMACVITILAFGISLFSLYKTQKEFALFIQHDQRELSIYKDLYANGLQMGQALRNIVINPDDEKAVQNYENAEKDFNASIKLADSIANGQGDKSLVAEIQSQREKQAALQKEIITSVKNDPKKAAEIMREKETPIWREIKDKTLEKIKALTSRADEKKELVDNRGRAAMILSSVLVILALSIGPVIFFCMRETVIKINTIITHLNRIERETDVGTPLPPLGKDEIGQIGLSINAFIAKIKDTVLKVWESTSGTMVTAKSLNELASKSGVAVISQNDSIMQISVAMEEISATVKDVAGNAHDAASVINKASHVVKEGAQAGRESITTLERINHTVTEASRTIRELDDSLDRIDEVANGIREITEQTNLLALSASIEAARAGEKGKGFAVVAEEVRTLSITTANFTADIVKIIKNVKESAISAMEAMGQTRKEVELSVTHGKKLEHALAEIERAVTTASGAMEGIAVATGQQSKAVEDVAANLEKVAGIAENTKEDIRHTSVAAESLMKASEDMQNLVAEFKFAYVTWTEEFSVKIDKFDNQHKVIFDMINELHRGIAAKHSQEALGPVLTRLIEYTASHFANEEKAMVKVSYPHLAAHKREHELLKDKVIDLQKKFVKGEAVLGVETLAFLMDWLRVHIAESDKKYGPFLSGKV